jgi:hypothetical protein
MLTCVSGSTLLFFVSSDVPLANAAPSVPTLYRPNYMTLFSSIPVQYYDRLFSFQSVQYLETLQFQYNTVKYLDTLVAQHCLVPLWLVCCEIASSNAIAF